MSMSITNISKSSGNGSPMRNAAAKSAQKFTADNYAHIRSFYVMPTAPAKKVTVRTVVKNVVAMAQNAIDKLNSKRNAVKMYERLRNLR